MVLVRQALRTLIMAAPSMPGNGSMRCSLFGQHSSLADLVSSTLGQYWRGACSKMFNNSNKRITPLRHGSPCERL